MSNNIFPPFPIGQDFYGPFVPATLTDGWCYGSVTEHVRPDIPEGCVSGDGFVVAPDGMFCGLVWWLDFPHEIRRLRGSRMANFFGVFEVRFPKPIFNDEDLAYCFRFVLPKLKRYHVAFLAKKLR